MVLSLRRDVSNSEAREFFLLAMLSWLITVATGAVGLIACISSSFKFDLTVIPIYWIIATFGVVVFLIYLVRKDFFILSISSAVAIIASFSSVAPIVAYAAAHLSYNLSIGLKDSLLASSDEFFKLDWVALLRWVDTHQWFTQILNFAYDSIILQAVCVTIALSLCGQYRRLQTFILALQISLLACAAVSIVVPALGEYSYRNIKTAFEFSWLPSKATSYVQDVVQLRTDAPEMPLAAFKGVITFPSFHATLAFLFVWGLWSVKFVRWASLLFNTSMIVAIPIFGGHYFCDIAAGLIVGICSIMAAKQTVKFMQERLISVEKRSTHATEMS